MLRSEDFWLGLSVGTLLGVFGLLGLLMWPLGAAWLAPCAG